MADDDATPGADAQEGTLACYRHPDREALLRCSRCERPICGDDMIEAPVGYQCPECAQGGRPVRHVGELLPQANLTRALVAVIAVVFVVSQVDGGALANRFALRPVLVRSEPWLLVTSGFLHLNLMHVLFNGYLLYRLGSMLERPLGAPRFGALYAAGLAGGSLGVVLQAWAWTMAGGSDIPILTSHPLTPTIGASGAVFALMGAAMTGLRERGINPWQTDIGGLVLLNLVITFVIPRVSVGGHVGGFLAGLLVGRLLFVARERAGRAAAITAAVAVGLFVLAFSLAWMIDARLILRG